MKKEPKQKRTAVLECGHIAANDGKTQIICPNCGQKSKVTRTY